MNEQPDPRPQRNLVKLADALRRHPYLSAYGVREMIRRGFVSGFRPTDSRLLLVDIDDIDRAVAASQVRAE